MHAAACAATYIYSASASAPCWRRRRGRGTVAAPPKSSLSRTIPHGQKHIIYMYITCKLYVFDKYVIYNAINLLVAYFLCVYSLINWIANRHTCNIS